MALWLTVSMVTFQGPGMLPNLNFLRKPACDFGWDWGPAFAPAGISGRVSLEAYGAPYLTGVLAPRLTRSVCMSRGC
jgi:hypothetical protein